MIQIQALLALLVVLVVALFGATQAYAYGAAMHRAVNTLPQYAARLPAIAVGGGGPGLPQRVGAALIVGGYLLAAAPAAP